MYYESREFPTNQDLEVSVLQNIIVDNAKVMAKGQITLPKDVRDFLKLNTGDRVTLICEDDRVILMNSAVYAMKVLQSEMAGAAKAAGIDTEEDIMDLVKEVRAEIEGCL